MNATLKPHRLHQDHMTIQQVGEETLVYDERTHHAWCLNRSSACIWRLCDGQMDIAEMAVAASRALKANVPVELVLVILEELREKSLLEPSTVSVLPSGVTRREMVRRIGMTAAVLLPVIAALTAPPARAQSGSVGTDGATD